MGCNSTAVALLHMSGWLCRTREGLAPRLLPGAGPGPAAAAHLLFGARHLEAGAEVVQPLPLLVPPQVLQVLPQHLDDLEQGAGLSCSVLPRRPRESCRWSRCQTGSV